MKATRQVVSVLLMAVILFSTTAIVSPTDSDAALKHLVACGSGATVAAKFLCPFGPLWCAAGLLGGCFVAVVVEEIPD
jgi:hypothetical protein